MEHIHITGHVAKRISGKNYILLVSRRNVELVKKVFCIPNKPFLSQANFRQLLLCTERVSSVQFSVRYVILTYNNTKMYFPVTLNSTVYAWLWDVQVKVF